MNNTSDTVGLPEFVVDKSAIKVPFEETVGKECICIVLAGELTLILRFPGVITVPTLVTVGAE
jgi:hypothetical protein